MNGGDGLVPQTHTEDGDAAREGSQQIRTDPGLIRRTRSGRNYQACWCSLDGFLNRNAVIANDLDINARREGAQALHKVPREGIVIIDEQNHEQVPEET